MRRSTFIAAATGMALTAALLGVVALAQDDDVMSPLAAITVADAWSSPSSEADSVGVAYVRLINETDGDDALVAATSPAAAVVELQQSTAADDGTIRVAQVETISVPAGGETLLEPGGYHLRLVDLVAPLTEGDDIELSLEFETAGIVAVTADVVAATADEAPATTAVAELPTRFTVEALDNFFNLKTLEAAANTEIRVTLNNYGVLPHNIVFFVEEGGALLADGSLSATIGGEETALAKFTTPGPGEYFFVCTIHPLEMTGTLTVR